MVQPCAFQLIFIGRLEGNRMASASQGEPRVAVFGASRAPRWRLQVESTGILKDPMRNASSPFAGALHSLRVYRRMLPFGYAPWTKLNAGRQPAECSVAVRTGDLT
jgi:hypothetical protein